MYVITNYTKDQAKKYGLTVKKSSVYGKKISVYKDDLYLGSVGALGYDDYGSYLKKYGSEYAEQRRKLYHERHKHENGYNEKYSKSWLSSNLLW